MPASVLALYALPSGQELHTDRRSAGRLQGLRSSRIVSIHRWMQRSFFLGPLLKLPSRTLSLLECIDLRSISRGKQRSPSSRLCCPCITSSSATILERCTSLLPSVWRSSLYLVPRIRTVLPLSLRAAMSFAKSPTAAPAFSAVARPTIVV